MINRRTFTTLLAGMVGVTAAPRLLWSQTAMPKTVLYTSVGAELTLFDIDIAEAALAKRGTVTLPANIQYAWPHPSTTTPALPTPVRDQPEPPSPIPVPCSSHR
jgi:6-phosphogluconolactonase